MKELYLEMQENQEDLNSIDIISGVRSEATNFNLESEQNIGVLKVRSANDCLNEAKNRPIPKMLFCEFWFQGEFCVLFADTNVGKSILAVQIANSISKGIAIPGFKLGVEKEKVLYFDFELTDKQFETRYSKEYTEHYLFDDIFFRIEINSDADPSQNVTFEDALISSIERAIIEKGANILIIDNITYLRTDTERAKDALPLMKKLKELKQKYDLSILILAHTPKRNLSQPITHNDLQGSKMIINFCDSAFSIGKSHNDNSLRYLKQIKQRNTEQIYDKDNVCVCHIDKPSNFLRFEFLNFGTETEHLIPLTGEEKTKKIEQIKELAQQGYTQRQIAKKVGMSLGFVNKHLKQ